MLLDSGSLKMFHLVCQLSQLGDDYLECHVADESRGMRAVQGGGVLGSESVMGGGVRDWQFSR